MSDFEFKVRNELSSGGIKLIEALEYENWEVILTVNKMPTQEMKDRVMAMWPKQYWTSNFKFEVKNE